MINGLKMITTESNRSGVGRSASLNVTPSTVTGVPGKGYCDYRMLTGLQRGWVRGKVNDHLEIQMVVDYTLTIQKTIFGIHD